MRAIRSEVAKYSSVITEKSLRIPEQFKNVPAQNLFDFSFEYSDRWQNYFDLVDDP